MRDASTLAAALESYRSLGNRMYQSIKTLKKYKRQAINALRYEYSNGFLNRIFLERVWFRANSSKAAA